MCIQGGLKLGVHLNLSLDKSLREAASIIKKHKLRKSDVATNLVQNFKQNFSNPENIYDYRKVLNNKYQDTINKNICQ